MAKFVDERAIIYNTKFREYYDGFKDYRPMILEQGMTIEPYEFGPDLEPMTTYAPISVKSLKRKYVEGLIDIEEFEERLPACIEYSDRYRPEPPEREPGMAVEPEYRMGSVETVMYCLIVVLFFFVLLGLVV